VLGPPPPDPAHPDRVLVMGVVNVTPDSFSDGGRYSTTEAAIAHGRALAAQGADIIDVGGEATGPRSIPVSLQDELSRVVPVVEALARDGVRVSIDTTKAQVAEAALAAGATIVNDVSGGVFDPRIREILAASQATYICGHLRGGSIAEVFAREAKEPITFDDVVFELQARLEALPDAVVARTWVDPGIGFGKPWELNLELAVGAARIGFALDRPVVIGPSRKRFLRNLLDPDPPPTEADLDRATVAVCARALEGGPLVLRVHNVTLLESALSAYNNE
jgi:dihydropteroate synthase